MGDMMSGGGGGGGGGGGNSIPDMGMGLMNYLSAIQANRNARAVNATNDKWGPMLSLYTKGGGAKNVEVPKASFAKIMGPAMSAAYNDMGSGGGGAMDTQAVGGTGGTMGEAGGLAGGQGEMMNGLGAMFASSGGAVPHYDGGGQQGGGGNMIGSVMKMLPMLAMMLDKGGQVPGKAPYPGDNPKNDQHLAVLSSDEVVLPRTVSKAGMNGNKWKVAKYLQDVKKHGPGPMPVKRGPSSMASSQSTTGSSQMKPQSKSMSPWQAMAKGGKMGC